MYSSVILVHRRVINYWIWRQIKFSFQDMLCSMRTIFLYIIQTQKNKVTILFFYPCLHLLQIPLLKHPFLFLLTSNSQISNNTNSSSSIEQSSTDTSMSDISSNTPPTLARKSTRVSIPPSYLKDYKCNSIQSTTTLSSHWCNLVSLNDDSFFSLLSFSDNISNEPSTYAEAARDSSWVAAMDAEIKALLDNKTCVLTDPPASKRTIG